METQHKVSLAYQGRTRPCSGNAPLDLCTHWKGMTAAKSYVFQHIFCHCANQLSKHNLITCPVSITWNLSHICSARGRLFAIGQVDWTGRVYHLSDGVKSEKVRSRSISGSKLCQEAHKVAFVLSVKLPCILDGLLIKGFHERRNHPAFHQQCMQPVAVAPAKCVLLSTYLQAK